MDILVIQHMTSGAIGALGRFLRDEGARLDERDIERGATLPASSSGHGGLVVLGGVMNAHEDSQYPHLGETARLIREFHDAGKPVLGLCLGAQLIARAFGREAFRHTVSEMGFVRHDLTAAAATDPLLEGVRAPLWLMQWHDDTFDMPDGAVLLMTSEACRNQALRVGEATYGLQGHPEVDPELLEIWLAGASRNGYHHAHPGFYARVREETARHIAASLIFSRTLAARWAAMVRERAKKRGRV